ncbi:MAG: TetR family transcriptional regulator C-terminal domain-containing protein [Coriobacteriales bacterium]|nr:TetR family transcriptional regulator C-terminal domain-containing protein [Coriobacteriales bacterium]
MRKTKTTQYLTTALISLIQKKEVSHITVKELCQSAQINRATFYIHYNNIQDFLSQLISNVVVEMTLLLDKNNRYAVLLHSANPTEKYCVAIQYVLDNADFFRAMFSNNGPADFQELLVTEGYNQLVEVLRPLQASFEDKIELDILANFIIHAELGSLNHYVRNNMKYSALYMSQQILTLISGILFALEINLPLAHYRRQ